MSYLTRQIANRGVHLRITPRPSNLGETREILRLLSQFGEIDYFKNLKYDGQGLGLPNIALVIYKDEEGAKNCFRGSPVRFRMGKMKAGTRPQEPPEEDVEEVRDGRSSSGRRGAWGLPESQTKTGPSSSPWGVEPDILHQRRYLSTSTLPKPTPRPIRMPFDPPSPPDTAAQKAEEEDRIFQIHTSSTRRNFRDQINMGHYHGSFAIDSKMPGQEDLVKRVPVHGMSCVDWRARERPWRFVKREAEGMDRKERLGALWEKAGGKEQEKKDEVGAFRDAFDRAERSKVGARGMGHSWSDLAMR